MAVGIGINGFGRIGRCVFRAARSSKVEVVGINDLANPETLAHLLKYDSSHGTFEGDVTAGTGALIVDGRRIPVSCERSPERLPWGEVRAQIVIESTGLFCDRESAAKHLAAGADRVVISAPATDPDVTIVPGVNDHAYSPSNHRVISLASCTTNCLAPVAKVLHERFGVARGWMTTIHAYTSDQSILDAPHSDLRRARAAALSMIPTTTGAAKAVGLVLPELKGRLDGYAIRVPTADVSAVDLSVELCTDTTAAAINEALGDAANGSLKGILQLCHEPLVSADFRGNCHSSVVDAQLTKIIDGDFVKLLIWYDNEWGYANRLVEWAERIGN
jgi:glyceraldehyde 3-phosphate dehydrogenase